MGMNEQIPIDSKILDELIKNPTVLKIVNIVNLASVSMLELIEFNCTIHEINFCLANKVLKFDRTISSREKSPDEHIPKGEYYNENLNKKVRLTEIGIYILDILEESAVQNRSFIIPESNLSLSTNIGDFVK